MITFRYHVFTITCVFLALGVGILLGSTFLDRTFVDALNNQVTRLDRSVREKGASVDRLTAALAVADNQDAALRDNALGQLLDGDLNGTSVVVVAPVGVDPDLVTLTTSTLRDDRAEVTAIVWLNSDLTTASADGRRRLVDATKAADADAATTSIATELLGRRAAKPRSSEPAVSGTSGAALAASPLAALKTARLVEVRNVKGAATDVPEFVAGTKVVMVVGEGQTSPSSDFAVPLAKAIGVADGRSLVVASAMQDRSRAEESKPENLLARSDAIKPFRDEAALDGRAVTIDDLDQPTGMVALLLSLRYLPSDVVGDFGIADGASKVLPEPPG